LVFAPGCTKIRTQFGTPRAPNNNLRPQQKKENIQFILFFCFFFGKGCFLEGAQGSLCG